MLESSCIVLNGFLNKHPVDEIEILVSPLSDKTKKMLDIYFSPLPIDPVKFSPLSILERAHYSWYVPFLKSFSLSERALLISFLPYPLSDKLEKYFEISKSSCHFSKSIAYYFQNLFFEYVLDSEKDILPFEYLPPSDLNTLLSLTKNTLIALIDYLALYDLAIQIPKIVDPRVLKMINSFLSAEKKQFLKTKHNYKEPFSFPRLPFEQIDTQEEFDILMHKRGLNRFAKALSTQNKSLIWFVCHKFDIGRGQTLQKFCLEPSPREIAKTITFNIMELLLIIKNK